MKLNVKAVVIAEAIVGAGLFILCRLAFAVAPNATLATLKYLTHIDWTSVTMPVSLGGFIAGLVVFTIFIAIVGGLWAWIYNLVLRTPSAA
jgi:small-conductance mechanosensitive channel